MNTTNAVRTFRVQVFSAVDHDVVLHTETVTCTADQQRETVDALAARFQWVDRPWHIQAV